MRQDLSHLEAPFTFEDVHGVIQEITAEKAPGPDGFIEVFLKCCWPLIKHDLLAALDYFFQLHDQHFSHLNSAHIALVPKTADAKRIGDFMPIILTHTVAKLFSNLLSNRLARA